jgi:hypothetical protein
MMGFCCEPKVARAVLRVRRHPIPQRKALPDAILRIGIPGVRRRFQKNKPKTAAHFLTTNAVTVRPKEIFAPPAIKTLMIHDLNLTANVSFKGRALSRKFADFKVQIAARGGAVARGLLEHAQPFLKRNQPRQNGIGTFKRLASLETRRKTKLFGEIVHNTDSAKLK